MKKKKEKFLKETQIGSMQYSGVCIFYFLWGMHKKNNPYMTHHITHAIAYLFMVFAIVAVYLALSSIAIYIGINHSDIMMKYRLDLKLQIVGMVCIGVFVIAYMILSIIASRGKTPRIFPLTGLSTRRWVHWTVTSIYCSLLAFTLTAIVCAIHASTITPMESENAKVYMLYDDMDGKLPQFPMAFAFYPVTLRAQELMGEDSVCVKPLSEESFQEAFSRGDYIFVSSHGYSGTIVQNSRTYNAYEAARCRSGPPPGFIYLTGCEISRGNNSWTEMFPETNLITFDRWCSVLEHFAWLMFSGADQLESVLN